MLGVKFDGNRRKKNETTEPMYRGKNESKVNFSSFGGK